MFRKLFTFGSFFLITSLFSTILLSLDKLLIGSLLSVALVTYYVVTGNIASKIQGFIGAAVNVIFPASSELFGTGQSERLQKMYSESTRVVIMAGFILAVPLFVFAHTFLLHWLGADFASKGTVVMQLLVPTYFILGVTGVAWSMCLGAGRAKINAFFAVLTAVLNVAFIFAFYKTWGLNGIAFAYLLAVVLGNPVAIWFIERRVLGVSGFVFWGKFARLILPAAAQAALGLVLVRFASSFLMTLILMAACAAAYPLFYALFGLTTEQDRNVIGAVIVKFRRSNDPGISA
jgi:O-antigen/teichoic acid export membrane protein